MKPKRKYLKAPQIHARPQKDSGLEHTLSLTCACQPVIKEFDKAITVLHNMIGSDLDSWVLDTVNVPSYTGGCTQ